MKIRKLIARYSSIDNLIFFKIQRLQRARHEKGKTKAVIPRHAIGIFMVIHIGNTVAKKNYFHFYNNSFNFSTASVNATCWFSYL